MCLGRATLQEETQLSAALQSKLRAERTAAAEAGTQVARLRAELAAAERRLSDRTTLCDRLSQQLRLVSEERLRPARQHRRQLETACSRMGGALYGDEYQLPVQGLAESSDEEEARGGTEGAEERLEGAEMVAVLAGEEGGLKEDGGSAPSSEPRAVGTRTDAGQTDLMGAGADRSDPPPPPPPPPPAARPVLAAANPVSATRQPAGPTRSTETDPVKPAAPSATASKSSLRKPIEAPAPSKPDKKTPPSPAKKTPPTPVQKKPPASSKKTPPSPARRGRHPSTKRTPPVGERSPVKPPERGDRARGRQRRRPSPEPSPAIQSVVQRPARRPASPPVRDRPEELDRPRRGRRPERFSGPLTGEGVSEPPPPPAQTVPPAEVSRLQWPEVLAEFSTLLRETERDDVTPRRAARYRPYESPLQPPAHGLTG